MGDRFDGAAQRKLRKMTMDPLQAHVASTQAFIRSLKGKTREEHRRGLMDFMREEAKYPWSIGPADACRILGSYGCVSDPTDLRGTPVRSALAAKPGVEAFVGRTMPDAIVFHGPGDDAYEPWHDLEFEFAVWPSLGEAVVHELWWARFRTVKAATVAMALTLFMREEGFLRPEDIAVAETGVAKALAAAASSRSKPRVIGGVQHLRSWE